MKKAMFRKIREICENVLGEDKTNKIIKETIAEAKQEADKEINNLLEETKPKKTTKKKESK